MVIFRGKEINKPHHRYTDTFTCTYTPVFDPRDASQHAGPLAEVQLVAHVDQRGVGHGQWVGIHVAGACVCVCVRCSLKITKRMAPIDTNDRAEIHTSIRRLPPLPHIYIYTHTHTQNLDGVSYELHDLAFALGLDDLAHHEHRHADAASGEGLELGECLCVCVRV
jgi:hypothetical protein